MVQMPDFAQRQAVLYDVQFDQKLISQSLTAQYGILPYTQENLPYRDWCSLVEGLSSDSPLGKVIAIRAETNHQQINQMTAAQKQIRQEWSRFLSKTTAGSEQDKKKQMEQLQQALKMMYQERREGNE